MVLLNSVIINLWFISACALIEHPQPPTNENDRSKVLCDKYSNVMSLRSLRA